MTHLSRCELGHDDNDRYYRAVGWIGHALASLGVLALVFAAVSFTLQ